ncbi:MAG: tetratricopeptide repeat protein [Nannocystaceae bacterium]
MRSRPCSSPSRACTGRARSTTCGGRRTLARPSDASAAPRRPTGGCRGGGARARAGRARGRGRPAEAALAQLEPALGPGHLDVARVVNNLGAALGALGRHEDAAAAFARVLAIFEAALGGEHPLVAAVQSNLGATADQRGHHEEALAHYQRALAMYERDLGAAHPLVASVLSNMGDTLRALGRLDEAHASLTRALELRRSALADHPRLAYSLTNLAVVELERGELASAREHFGQARAILERSFGERHRSLGPPLVGLGRVALATGECDEAIELLRAALMTDGGDDPLPDEDDPLALIAALWRRVDRREAALALARAQQQRSPAPELAAWLSAHDPERAP